MSEDQVLARVDGACRVLWVVLNAKASGNVMQQVVMALEMSLEMTGSGDDGGLGWKGEWQTTRRVDAWSWAEARCRACR